MHGKQLVKKFAMDLDQLDQLIGEALGQTTEEQLADAMGSTVGDVAPNAIVKGKILRILEDGTVFVDAGYKSEGRIPLDEFENPEAVQAGMEVECLVEAIDDEDGYIELSKRKADRIRGWEKIIETHSEGDVVEGDIVKKIKGGLLVEIGVPVFLPASQVDIRRVGDIGEWIGQHVRARIIKIDEERMNIVVSRRKLIEEEREKLKTSLLAEIDEGQIRTGVVKNIAEFGVFVDLGGLDGLLHITDMSWGRINHPSEMVAINDEVEVKVLKIDRERERIALGMKQTEVNPWDMVSDTYPPGTIIRGRVRNLTNYGAFIELQEGIDGLLHITDMSWTKKITHPSEVVKKGEEVECVVLSVDQEKKRIALGLKQLQADPWTSDIPARYHIGDSVPGTVTKITNFGVFVELEAGLEGLLHVSELADHKVDNPEDVVKIGQKVEVRIIKIDPDERKIGLTLIQTHFEEGEAGETSTYSEPEPAPAFGALASQLKDLGARVREAEKSKDDEPKEGEDA